MTEEKSQRELKAAKYEAEAKALRRAEKAFWIEAEERLEEVKKKFKLSDVTEDKKKSVSDKFTDICRKYDVESEEEKEELYTHIVSAKQIEYFFRAHPRKRGEPSGESLNEEQGDARGV